jgi:hypothetical protein
VNAIEVQAGPGAQSSISRPDSSSIDKHLEHIAFMMDRAIKIPGTNIRFGLDPIIGLILPEAGDAITMIVSAYIVIASVRYGLAKIVIARMVFNIAVDYLIGSIPLIGDLFDFAWKANEKNLRLLNQHASGTRHLRWSDWAWVFILLSLIALLVLGSLVIVILAIRVTGLHLV